MKPVAKKPVAKKSVKKPATGRPSRLHMVESISAPGELRLHFAEPLPHTPIAPPSALPSPSPVSSAPAAPQNPVTAPRIAPRRRYFVAAGLFALVATVGTASVSDLGRSSSVEGQSRMKLGGTAFEATIRPSNQFTIAAPLTTTVQRLFVSVGQKVDVGQPLMIVDDRTSEAALRAAELELQEADVHISELKRRIAALERVPADAYARASGRLAQAQSEANQIPSPQTRYSPERAQTVYDQAKLRADRTRSLFDRGIVSRQEMEDADAALKVAAHDLETATRSAAAGASLQKVQTEAADLQVQVARAEKYQQVTDRRAELMIAEVRRQEAELKVRAARQQLASSIITASSPGVVVELPVRPGDQIYSGAPLVKLASIESLVAEVQIAPALVNALRPGMDATIALPNGERVVRGRVSAIGPMPVGNGNHLVEVQFGNPEKQLLAGQSAEVRFTLR